MKIDKKVKIESRDSVIKQKKMVDEEVESDTDSTSYSKSKKDKKEPTVNY